MATFEPIVEWLLYQEDNHRSPGMIENLGDGAGLTRLGITSKNFGTVIDPTFWTTMPFSAAVVHAKDFYENQYWHHINGDKIVDDQIAAMILSWSVNRNISVAVRNLQATLGLDQDGVLGLVTLQKLNTAQSPKVLAAFYRSAWISSYQRLADSIPADQKFLDGWINRANFPYPSPLVGNLYQ